MIIQAIYSLKLTTNSPKISRDCSKADYYYEAIQVNVDQSGFYSFSGTSSMDDPNGILYHIFDPTDTLKDRWFSENRCNHQGRFQFSVELDKDITYTLVVTTLQSNMIGNFSVTVFGSGNVTLNRISE